MAGLDTGVLAFQVLAKHLRDTGRGDLKKELGDAITDAAKPAMAEVRKSLPLHMPGGYAEVLDADLRLTLTRNFTTTPGVRITATNRGFGGVQRRRLRRLEAGILAHPLFGNRQHWFYQTDGVTEGFFSGPLEDSGPQVREAILRAMARVAEDVTRKA